MIILSLFEQTYANYMVALIFLGFGWNFLFISGTSLVVSTDKEQIKQTKNIYCFFKPCFITKIF